MIKTTALTLSVLANVALLVLWLSAARSESAAMELPGGHVVRRAAAAEGDFARWLALGLSEHEAKRLLFATFEATAVAAIDSPWEHYWQSGDPGLAYGLALTQAYGRVRSALDRTFGTGAAAVAEFSRAFRPLNAQFAFLSGAEQIELQQRRLHALERRANSTTALARPGAPEPPPISDQGNAALDFLTPAAAFEVALRDSPRAEQLRHSGAGLDEHEFREAFALLERLDTNTDLSVQAETRRHLRVLLGAQRLTAVTATRDPLFAVVERAGGEHGLDAAAIAAAYEVLSDAQGQLLDLAAARLPAERAASEAAGIAAAEHEGLDAAAGEPAAAAIRAARDEFHVGARRVASATRSPPAP